MIKGLVFVLEFRVHYVEFSIYDLELMIHSLGFNIIYSLV